MKRLIVLLFVGGTTLCARAAFGLPQAGGAPAIRVESNEVLVPAIVYTREHGDPVFGLTVRDFRLFEDGQEQKIQKVVVERDYERDFRNSSGVKEGEWAWTPGQKWSTLGGMPGDFYTRDVYVLAYVPPHSAEGSCHNVKKKKDRKNVFVVARGEYCHTAHSPSDPLAGTNFSKQMEDDAASADAGKIPLSVQAGFFYRDMKAARIYITVEFSSNAIKFRNDPHGLRHEIGVLAMVYRKDGTLAARSSDLDEDSGPINYDILASPLPVYDLLKGLLPDHHEAQLELPPGDYDLRVVLSDGSKFGRVQLPLTVDSYDGKQLAISSIILCKQFHDRTQTLPDPGHEETLSGFVPLVSKGLEFTPAGDTSFGKKESLFAYYEVYEPLLAGQPETTVQTRMRIINAETGELKVDSGLRSAQSWMQAGNPVISISQEVAVDKLTKGSYRMEVQASDSAGRSTVWRTANFTIE